MAVREAATETEDTAMNIQRTTRRHTWHSLSQKEQQSVLQRVRREQQHSVEHDLRRLRHLT